jgi:NADH:ubiquinone reductase (H+-translocating)
MAMTDESQIRHLSVPVPARPPARPPAVVVGAGYAGVMAANRLASHGTRARLVTPAEHFVERIRLHQHIAGTATAVRPLKDVLHPAVEVVAGEVDRVDAAVRRLALKDGRTIAYERVVLATGSISTAPAGSWDVGRPGQADQARRHLAALGAGSTVVVVGGGLTGLETATEVAGARPDLTVELVSSSLLADLLPGTVARATRGLRRLGVRVVHGRVLDVEGTDLEGDGTDGAGTDRADVLGAHGDEATTLVLDDGTRLPAALVLWCGPMRAAPLARASGLPVDTLDRLLVDDLQRSLADSHVYGAGDAAAHPANRRMSCQSALPSGAAAADAVLAHLDGRAVRPFTMKYSLRCISLGRHDGLIQPSHGDDRPLGPSLAGRAAAVVKEQVCAATVGWLAGQAHGKQYRWRR